MGSLVGTVLGGPGGGTVIGAALGHKKLMQTTWNRMNGSGQHGHKKDPSVGGVLEATSSEDNAPGKADSGLLSEANNRNAAADGTLVVGGPNTFGYGTTLGG